MNKRILLGLTLATTICSSIIAVPPNAQAQTNNRTNIRDLQQRSKSTNVLSKVTNIVGNDFIINDGTGQLIVDAGPRWWREINLQPGEQVTVNSKGIPIAAPLTA